VTNNRIEKADYVVVLDHEGGKGYLQHRNKVAVFARVSGDSVMSRSTLSLGNSVKDACDGIDADWKAHGATIRAATSVASSVAEQQSVPAGLGPASLGASLPGSVAKLSLTSVPDGAEIEVDGNFVGSTPSTIDLPPGTHAIVVKKKGFANWERKAQLLAGDVRINAELDDLPHVTTTPTAEVAVAKSPIATQAPASQPSVTPVALVAVPASKAPDPAPEPVPDRAVPMDPVTVAVISDPQGAELFVDSKGFGSTPKQFQLVPGSHSIQVVKAGYKDWSTKLVVEPGAPTTVKAKLEK
jgi:hypothetical protein